MTEISQGLFVIPSSTEYLSNPLWNKTQCVKKVKVKSLSRVQLFGTPWTIAHQAPPSMEFSRKSTGVGCHFLLHGIFPTQGLDSGHLQCRWILYRLSHQESPPTGISGNEYILLLSSHNLLLCRNYKT